ncbi:MAG: type II secretion system protein GspC [Syntrophales bacterium]|jgi:general secretion pathway protein C|nr:type II secretion system protein GspC [Syntrophales bacterium]MDY0045379.1 type II secretion system protein GspC [Syntrophales bacterium]
MKSSYRIVFILFAITAISYLTVDIFYSVILRTVSSVKKQERIVEKSSADRIFNKEPLDAFEIISARNLFGSAEKKEAQEEEAAIDVDELEPTKLKLALLGTVSGSDKFDYAVIEEQGKRNQGLFRVGDIVSDATIKKIMRTRVILRVGDKDEILAMEDQKKERPKTAGGRPAESEVPRKISVDKDVIDEALKDVTKIMSQVRVRPYFSGGKPDGFMVSRIAPGSLFQKMGLQNGDVIQGINGDPLGSPKEVIDMYGKLETGSEITLNIKRRGRQETLQYTFNK